MTKSFILQHFLDFRIIISILFKIILMAAFCIIVKKVNWRKTAGLKINATPQCLEFRAG